MVRLVHDRDIREKKIIDQEPVKKTSALGTNIQS